MIKIRKELDSDAEVVESIIAAATDELRSIYRAKNNGVQKETDYSVTIVAIIDERIVGTAEFIVNRDSLLVRGLAVSPAYRRQGVAGAMTDHIISIAKNEGKADLRLSTIKETGNANIFLRMGFNITSEQVSDVFEGVQGEPVTLVNMRKAV